MTTRLGELDAIWVMDMSDEFADADIGVEERDSSIAENADTSGPSDADIAVNAINSSADSFQCLTMAVLFRKYV